MKRERTEKEKAADRRRCLNGRCRMTPQERKERKRKYMAEVRENPFRRKQYADYFRKRRGRPGMKDHINALARTRYAADIEKSRAYCRLKYAKTMSDPVKRAAYNTRRRERRKITNAARRDCIRNRLMPLWETVLREGREESYCRRTTTENAQLFMLWKNNPTLFNQMMERRFKKGNACG